LDGEQFDRNNVFVGIENRIKQITKDPIITVHMVASTEVIETRMSDLKGHPEHTNSPLLPGDIENVKSEYQYFIERSDIGPVVKVDTSVDSAEQTLEKIVNSIEPYFTETDLERIETHKSGE